MPQEPEKHRGHLIESRASEDNKPSMMNIELEGKRRKIKKTSRPELLIFLNRIEWLHSSISS
jgi:hypothetical protein